MSSGTDSRIKKSRNRVPISCEPCRKKKLKCDRTKPCSSCVKNKTQYSCKYANQNLDNMNKMQLTTEIINLKMKVNKLEKILQANNINASEYSDLSFVFNESISRMCEDQEDPVLDLSDKFDRMIFKENRMLRSGATSYVTFIKADKQLSLLFEALNKRHEQEYEDYMNAQKTKVQHDSKMFDNSQIARKHAYQDKDFCMDSILSGMTTTTLTAPELLKSHDLIALASSKLPPMYAIDALIDRFFTHAYYLVPFVDEETFREELTYVLLSDEKGNPSFKVTHHQNTSIVSLLLIILRYAYMTINVKEFDENPRSIEDENLATMLRMGIVIGPQYVELAKNVLLSMPPEESIFRKVTIRNIQVLMFLRWYQSYSPELSEDYYEASISLSLIIQMCRVLGINRDPDHFPEVFRDEKVKNLRRRIFYKLFYMDTLSAFDLGTPVVIHPDEYDVRLPKISAKDKATLDDFKRGMSISITGKQLKSIINENAINRDIDLEFEVAKLIRRALQLCRNYDDGAKKSDFLTHIQRIELFLNSRLSSIYEMLDSGELTGSFKIEDPIERIFNISKIKKLEMRLVLLSLLNCLHYLLFLYASEDQEEEKLEHAVKASEPALILFKFTYDFVKYLTESSTIHGASKSHQNFKRFFNGLEIPFASKVQACFNRGILWTMSIFLQNFTSDHLKFEILLKKFGNSVDSVVVLNWLNIDLDRNTNDQFLIIMFHYLKEYYLNTIGLKADFFCCWRVSMIIKIFFNFFKNTKQERFEKVLTHYELASENQNLRKDFTYAEARIMNSDPDKLKRGPSSSNISNPLESEPTQLTTKGFDQIIYDNGDECLDDLLKEDHTHRPPAHAYSFFSVPDCYALADLGSFQSSNSFSVNRPSETDSFSHSNSTDHPSTDHPSTKSSGSVGNVTFDDPSKVDVMSFGAPDLVSPFDTYASQISAMDQEVPGEKSINLQDFISQFSKDPMFSS